MEKIDKKFIKEFKSMSNNLNEKAMKFARLMVEHRYHNQELFLSVPDWITKTDSPSYCEYSHSKISVIYNIHGDTSQIDIPLSLLEMSVEKFENICLDYRRKIDEKRKALEDREQADRDAKEYQEYLKLKEKYSLT